MSEWYIDKNGREQGPWSSEQLKSRAASGVISPDTPIRKASSEKWHKAGDIKGLFATVETTPLAMPSEKACLDCAMQIPIIAKKCPYCQEWQTPEKRQHKASVDSAKDVAFSVGAAGGKTFVIFAVLILATLFTAFFASRVYNAYYAAQDAEWEKQFERPR